MRSLGPLLLLGGFLTACAGIPVDPIQGAGQSIADAGAATGNPALYVFGTIAAAVGAHLTATKRAQALAQAAAQAKDNEEATPADAESMASALRAAGYKVERVT